MHNLSRRDLARLAGAAWALEEAGRRAVAVPAAADEVAALTIVQASQLLRAGNLTCTALTEACLERARIYNPKVNAYITVMQEEARAQAAQLDTEAKASRLRGPLHGIPIALKDNIDTAGTRTSGGSAVYDDRFPDADATVVRQLKAAGAVIIGKTNLQEFAMGGTSVSTYFLPVRNPWGLDRITGGSSGGSGVAVIADLTVGALGTDTGGSVRIPASHCGIVGLKPTYGLVSIRGIIPRTYSLDHCGPMTKTVEDAAVLLEAITGYDKLDVASVEHAKENYLAAARQPVSGFRVGIPRVPFFDRLDSEVGKAIEAAIRVVAGLTKGVKEMHLPGPGTYSRALLDGEIEAAHWELYKRNSGRYSLYQRHMIEAVHKGLNDTSGEACSAKVVDYVLANWELIRLRKTVDDAFADYDAVVLPTMRMLPQTINEALKEEEEPQPREPQEITNSAAFNTFGIPAVSIPCGFSGNGLPIGLMIAGPRFAEGKVLALARAYEQATEWHTRRPKLEPDMPVPGITRKG